MGTRVKSAKGRFRGRRIPADGNKCLYGGHREPEQVIRPAHKGLTYRALSMCIDGLAEAVERMMEGEEE